jgi:hypothetical protein
MKHIYWQLLSSPEHNHWQLLSSPEHNYWQLLSSPEHNYWQLLSSPEHNYWQLLSIRNTITDNCYPVRNTITDNCYPVWNTITDNCYPVWNTHTDSCYPVRIVTVSLSKSANQGQADLTWTKYILRCIIVFERYSFRISTGLPAIRLRFAWLPSLYSGEHRERSLQNLHLLNIRHNPSNTVHAM